MPLPRVVVLISGRGSNLAAILAAELPLSVVAVISNRQAEGLNLAIDRGIPTRVILSQDYPEREVFDERLRQIIEEYRPDGVVLAGYMRLLTPVFVRHYARRLFNIHPSLLPAFKGLHTHRRALEAGVAVHGATVHLVTEELDGGPIVAQAVVPVLPGDDETRLAQRVLAMEHRIFPEVLRAWAEGRLMWRHERPVLCHSSGAEDRRCWGVIG